MYKPAPTAIANPRESPPFIRVDTRVTVTTRPAAISAVLLALVLALCGTALADNYTYQRIPRDNAAAAAITVRAADLPKQLGLTGGRVKPDETPNSDSCNGYHPRSSDLVVTGDAETRYTDHRTLTVDSQVSLLKTAAMAAADVKRELPLLSSACSKQVARQEHVKLFSYRMLGPARCPCDDSLSFLMETPTKNPAVHLLMIVTVMRRGRIEASVMTGVGKSTADTNNVALTGRRRRPEPGDQRRLQAPGARRLAALACECFFECSATDDGDEVSAVGARPCLVGRRLRSFGEELGRIPDGRSARERCLGGLCA